MSRSRTLLLALVGILAYLGLAGTLLVLAASLALLNLALRHLPVGTAYAVWTGIGAVGAALMGVLWMGDSASIGRLACMGLIVGGVMGLRWLP